MLIQILSYNLDDWLIDFPDSLLICDKYAIYEDHVYDVRCILRDNMFITFISPCLKHFYESPLCSDMESYKNK